MILLEGETGVVPDARWADEEDGDEKERWIMGARHRGASGPKVAGGCE